VRVKINAVVFLPRCIEWKAV